RLHGGVEDRATALGPRQPAARTRRHAPHRTIVGMVDFAAEGLLDDLEGEARDARAKLLARLHREGVSLDDLRDAVADDTLVLLPAERLVGGIKRYTPRDVSEQSGVELEFLIRLRRAQGLPIPDADAPVFTDADVEGAKTARTFRE